MEVISQWRLSYKQQARFDAQKRAHFMDPNERALSQLDGKPTVLPKIKSSGGFPIATTMILEGHKDEVWDIEWSHDGNFLASASKDRSAIIWRIGISIVVYLNEEFFYPP